MAEEVKAAVAESEGKNFIDAFIEEDIAEGGQLPGSDRSTPVFRLSRTAICTSATARR